MIGELLYVKSTEEPVIALLRLWNFRLVRRPLDTFLGLFYKLTWFHCSELETEEEQAKRIFQRVKLRNEIAMTDMEAVEGPLSQLPLQFKKPS